MNHRELIAYLRQDPAECQLECGFHGPLEGLRALPQAFWEGAKAAEADPEDDPGGWLLLAERLEEQLEDFKELADDMTATLELEFDLTEDLQYAMAAARARPELEIAVTGFLTKGGPEGDLSCAWYSPAGSPVLAPAGLESLDCAEDFVSQAAGRRLPPSAQQWFPDEEPGGEWPGL